MSRIAPLVLALGVGLTVWLAPNSGPPRPTAKPRPQYHLEFVSKPTYCVNVGSGTVCGEGK